MRITYVPSGNQAKYIHTNGMPQEHQGCRPGFLLPGANDPGRYRVAEGWPTVGSAEGQRDHNVRYASPNKAPTVSATPVGCT